MNLFQAKSTITVKQSLILAYIIGIRGFFQFHLTGFQMTCIVDSAVLFLESYLILVSHVSVLLHDLFYTPVSTQCRLVNKINHACHLVACQI